jgi:hypothetical protein
LELTSLITFREGFQSGQLAFLKSILSDQELVYRLAKKRRWTFHNFSTYSLVLTTIPQLENNIIGLTLVNAPRIRDFTIGSQTALNTLGNNLGRYASLRELTVGRLDSKSLNLDLLWQVCPDLSVLKITGRLFQRISGSFRGFSSLQELVLRAVNNPRPPQIELLTLSAESLRVLHLDDISYDLESISLFANLSSLCIPVSKEAVCSTIIEANFTLLRFGVGFLYSSGDEITLEMIISVLLAPSLSKVEDLCLDLDYESDEDFEEWTEEGCHDFIRAISFNLKSLQILRLLGIPFRRNSFQPLPQLTNIKSVTWMGQSLDIEDVSDEDVTANVYRLEIEKELAAAFLDQGEDPEIKVELLAKGQSHYFDVEW